MPFSRTLIPRSCASFVREMILDYQKFTHELGLMDVYNQGVMSSINAGCWSPGFKHLYAAVKSTLDPKGILNAGLWLETRMVRMVN